MSGLAIAWYWIIGVCFIVYAVLDGFDLGIGVIFPFVPREERERLIGVVGPFWDGNEVWLLAAGGALFAAFPGAYATVFSGMYLGLMLVLAGLILRAAAFEFRHVSGNPLWVAGWDLAFTLGSVLVPLVLGLAAGNLLQGMPLSDNGDYAGTFVGLFTPFPLLCGLLAVIAAAFQGALFSALRTQGDSRHRYLVIASWVRVPYQMVLVILFFWGAVISPIITINLLLNPWLGVAPVVVCIGVIAAGRLIRYGRVGAAFIASCAVITALGLTAGACLFPWLAPTFNHPGAGISIANAASSDRTLWAMLVVALIGMPLVVIYHIVLYRVFRHRDEGGDAGY